jgi:hypothetical protein
MILSLFLACKYIGFVNAKACILLVLKFLRYLHVFKHVIAGSFRRQPTSFDKVDRHRHISNRGDDDVPVRQLLLHQLVPGLQVQINRELGAASDESPRGKIQNFPFFDHKRHVNTGFSLVVSREEKLQI